jgi:hypothetical protein
MNNNRIAGRTWWGALAAVVAVSAVVPVVFAQTSAKTAQSVMMNLNASGHLLVEGTSTWSYDRECAKPYFDNFQAISPVVVGCTGSAANCASTNAPATAPAAPAPDAQKLVPVTSQAACDFWTGTALGVSSVKASYNQSVTLNGLNGKGNWSYTWAYTVTANSDPGAEHTCWNEDSSETTNAELTFDARIMGLSTTVQKGSTIPKASFTLTDALGTRVQGLSYELTDETSTIVSFGSVDHSIKVGADYPDQGYFFGELYQGNANAGTGNVAQLAQFNGKTVGTILDTDGFANNNTNRGGATTVHVADTTPITLSIAAAGTYSLKMSGSIKGNDGTITSGFSVASKICVDAGSCSLCL